MKSNVPVASRNWEKKAERVRPSESKKAMLASIKAKNIARHKADGMTHRLELHVYKGLGQPRYSDTLIRYVRCVSLTPEKMAQKLLSQEGSTCLTDFKIEEL